MEKRDNEALARRVAHHGNHIFESLMSMEITQALDALKSALLLLGFHHQIPVEEVVQWGREVAEGYPEMLRLITLRLQQQKDEEEQDDE